MKRGDPFLMARYIFITGGVVSSLGKGLASAALGALLQARGFSVRMRKLDPYLNVDPGTMSPFEHGEVFVTDDGAETDLDLGHYERFTGVAARMSDSVSSGRIYSTVLEKERRGDYLGKTIQVVPHVTDEIKKFLKVGDDEVDFMLCEIGGTVGDIEGLPFFEAIRQFSHDKPRGDCIFMHLTLLPYLAASGELKTKPTQHSVKELQSIGIAPDILVCRSEHPIPEKERSKIALFCNVRKDAVVAAYDLKSIYEAPLAYHAQGLDQAVLEAFDISPSPKPDLAKWVDVQDRVNNPEGEVNVAIVGKYTQSNFGVVFLNNRETLPRHPAQLYEAICYIILFFILRKIYKTTKKDQPGFMIGIFFTGMFTIRFLIEFIKESQGGFEEIMPFFSTGQWLSIPLILLGIFLAFKKTKLL